MVDLMEILIAADQKKMWLCFGRLRDFKDEARHYSVKLWHLIHLPPATMMTTKQVIFRYYLHLIIKSIWMVTISWRTNFVSRTCRVAHKGGRPLKKVS